MSWWNAKYPNNHGEYELTFASKNYEKAKAVEKVCCAVMDKVVKSPLDIATVRHGRWDDEHKCTVCHNEAFYKISNIRPDYDYDWEENLVETGDYIWDIEWVETSYCPNCGAIMDGDRL